ATHTLLVKCLIESLRRLEKEADRKDETIRSLREQQMEYLNRTIRRLEKDVDEREETIRQLREQASSVSTATPLTASAPATQIITSTAQITDVDMVMASPYAPATLLSDKHAPTPSVAQTIQPQQPLPAQSNAIFTDIAKNIPSSSTPSSALTSEFFRAPIDAAADPSRSIPTTAVSTTSPTFKSEFFRAPIDAPADFCFSTSTGIPTTAAFSFGRSTVAPTTAASRSSSPSGLFRAPIDAAAGPSGTSTIISKEHHPPRISSFFSKPTAAPGHGKDMAPMQPSSNCVDEIPPVPSSLPLHADGTRTFNPAPMTKSQAKRLAQQQINEAAAAAEGIKKSKMAAKQINEQQRKELEDRKRQQITVPVPDTRTIIIPGNKSSLVYFSAFPRKPSSVRLTATVSLLSIDAYNRIPPEYQPDMLKYTKRPHVWIHYYHNPDPRRVVMEHPLGPSGVVDHGPFFRYDELSEHVTYAKNDKGEYPQYTGLEAVSPRKRRSDNAQHVAHSVLELVKTAEDRRNVGWVTPRLWFWKQVTVNTGLGAGIPYLDYVALFGNVDRSHRRRAEVGFRPVKKGDCEITGAPMTDGEEPVFSNQQRFFMVCSSDGDPYSKKEANVYDVMAFFEEADGLQRELELTYSDSEEGKPLENAKVDEGLKDAEEDKVLETAEEDKVLETAVEDKAPESIDVADTTISGGSYVPKAAQKDIEQAEHSSVSDSESDVSTLRPTSSDLSSTATDGAEGSVDLGGELAPSCARSTSKGQKRPLAETASASYGDPRHPAKALRSKRESYSNPSCGVSDDKEN
ncbi:hypothetical protein HDU81_009816, partial [Chytriomyces hyalinus]